MWRRLLAFAAAPRSSALGSRRCVRMYSLYCPEPDRPSCVDTVIYHRDCMDGFGAAFSAWKLLGNRAMYVSASHGSPPPDLRGKHVAICDFAYPRATTENLLRTCASLVVLDHHQTAVQALQGLPNMRLDQSHSGAVLAWKYFHPDQPVPRLLAYIEDRDLWRWELPHSREFSAALFSLPFDFEQYDRLLDDREVQRAIERGHGAIMFQNKLLDIVLRDVARVRFRGHRTAVINSALLTSELGNSALMHFPDAELALVYRHSVRTGSFMISLRSRSPTVDCAALAARYGGGGHPQAAAFRWSGSLEALWEPLDATTTSSVRAGTLSSPTITVTATATASASATGAFAGTAPAAQGDGHAEQARRTAAFVMEVLAGRKQRLGT